MLCIIVRKMSDFATRSFTNTNEHRKKFSEHERKRSNFLCSKKTGSSGYSICQFELLLFDAFFHTIGTWNPKFWLVGSGTTKWKYVSQCIIRSCEKTSMDNRYMLFSSLKCFANSSEICRHFCFDCREYVVLYEILTGRALAKNILIR